MTEEQQNELQKKLKSMSPEQLQELQKQNCVFCRIVKGEIPSLKVYEDEVCISVLDINPASKGHLLILPKEHYAILPQMKDQQLGHLFVVAKKLSQVLLKALRAEGTNVFIANGQIAGQRAQHVILHLIPRKEGDKILDLNEKVLDAELLGKVKEMLQPRIEELLGIKKAEKPKPAKKTAKKARKSNEADNPPKMDENETILDDISELFK